MTNQKRPSFKNEYLSKNTVIVIENIYSETSLKLDIIKNILNSTVYRDGENVIESSRRNTADYGSQAKEAEK